MKINPNVMASSQEHASPLACSSSPLILVFAAKKKKKHSQRCSKRKSYTRGFTTLGTPGAGNRKSMHQRSTFEVPRTKSRLPRPTMTRFTRKRFRMKRIEVFPSLCLTFLLLGWFMLESKPGNWLLSIPVINTSLPLFQTAQRLTSRWT
jgi:hypothetical protein